MEEFLVGEKGSALLIVMVFIVVFLVLLSVLFGMYLFEVRLYSRYINIYRSEIAIRDVLAVVTAEEKVTYDKVLDGSIDKTFVYQLATYGGEGILTDKGINLDDRQWLQFYPLPPSYSSIFPKVVLRLEASESGEEEEQPDIKTLAVVYGGRITKDKILSAINDSDSDEKWVIPHKFTDRKTFAQYSVVRQDLNRLGNTANVTSDYGPYARLDGDIIFGRGPYDYLKFHSFIYEYNTMILWGINPNGENWYVKDKDGSEISSSQYRTMMDTAILGNFYFGGDDIILGEADIDEDLIGWFDLINIIDVDYDGTFGKFYVLHKSSKVDIQSYFAGISIKGFPSESDAKSYLSNNEVAKKTDWLYYYDPDNNIYRAIAHHTATSPAWQNSREALFNKVFDKDIEVNSQYARDIINYLFNSDSWGSLVIDPNSQNSAVNRATKDSRYFNVNDLKDRGTVIGGTKDWNSNRKSLVLTFYVDSDKNTHIIMSTGDYGKNVGIYVDKDRKIYDVNLADLSHGKVLLDFSGYRLYIISPCNLRYSNNNIEPTWYQAQISSLPICQQVASINGKNVSNVFEVNEYINPQARDVNKNPNWQYDWTNYVYGITPNEFDEMFSTSGGVEPRPYHANWQNVNMYSMKITIIANNVYLVSNLVPYPKGDDLVFEQNLSNAKVIPNKDIPNLTAYPDGEVMAMYVKNNFLIKTYSCGDNYYDDRKNILACRGAAMYGFRFAPISNRFISGDFNNFYSTNSDEMELHAWDTLFYSYLIAVNGDWGLDTVDNQFPYTLENFKKMGTMAQGGEGHGMISPESSEGHQGFYGNRFYLISDNPYSNPPAYWIIPPEKYRSVTIVNYRMGR